MSEITETMDNDGRALADPAFEPRFGPEPIPDPDDGDGRKFKVEPETEQAPNCYMSATYDPADNKLRLTAFRKLGDETYQRVKAAGFSWAPKQKIFIAGAWTPDREDLLLELCGEIGDEDTSLVDRAEERAERFEDYSEKRLREAESAKRSVDAIADHIPFGQPILVGHHSEKRARKDRERIENGISRAVNLWKTSTYWTDRAAAAVSHARYLERPDVRHRRIKGIEADKRKVERSIAESAKWLRLWTTVANETDAEKRLKMALAVANVCWCYLPRKEGDKPDFDGKPTAYDALTNAFPSLYAPRTLEEVIAVALPSYSPPYTQRMRWIEHYDNRLAYERAMLGESGGIKADGFDLQVGGRVLSRGEWYTVTKLNRSGGAITSISTGLKTYPRTIDVERITDYQAPAPEETAKVKAATKLPPMANYPEASVTIRPHTVDPVPIQRRALEMTKAEWDRLYKDYKTSVVIKGTDEYGTHRVRSRWTTGNHQPVYLTDSKRVDPPKPDKQAPAPPLPAPMRDLESLQRSAERNQTFRAELAAEAASPFAKLEDALKGGIKTVVVDQLFPTPPEVAARLVELAELEATSRVLEPSAGTGNLIGAVLDYAPALLPIVAVDVSQRLIDALSVRFPQGNGGQVELKCADFLTLRTLELGTFDRIVMNPPFKNAEDIKHVQHALKFLRPCGRLVAIVANGPRQQAALRDLADEWHELPPGSFADSGTNVNAAICVFNA